MRASNFLLVFSTAPDRKTALKISKLLLAQKVAACINLSGPILSLYPWKGKQQQAKEILLLIKTRKSLFPKLQKLIQKNHPYLVPEIMGVPFTAGSSAYLDWLWHETEKTEVGKF